MKTHSILRNLFKKVFSALLILFVSFLSFSPLSFSSRQRSKLFCKRIISSKDQDYQRKEEKINELDKYIKQILQKPGFISPDSEIVSFGELEVNLRSKVAKRNSVKLELTSVEFLILVLLIHSSNQYITVQSIQERLPVTYSRTFIQTCLNSLSQKIGFRSPISTSSYPMLSEKESVYLLFEKRNKSQSLVKINKIPLGFKITSIDKTNKAVWISKRENHSQVTQEKQINLGGRFDFFLSLLDLFKYAGETLSLEQISQMYIRKNHFTDITETSLNDLSKKIPGLFFVNRHLYTLNPYVLDERIMKEYQIEKEPRDLQEVSDLKISPSSPLPAIYYEGYRHNISSTQLKILLFLLKNPEEFFPIQYIREQINDSFSFSDASKSEEEMSVHTIWILMKNLLDIFTPLGVDLRVRVGDKEKKTKSLSKSDKIKDEFGFFGLKRPNSFLTSVNSLALNGASKILTIDGVRHSLRRQKRVDFLSQLITHTGSIVTVSQFPSSFFDDKKAWPFLSPQKAESQFDFFNKVFGEAFIPIKIFVKDQWFTFGYKLVYSFEPQWKNYFISHRNWNMDFSIQLDPVFQRIEINNREFSLPYLNFKVLRVILNAFQEAPYLEERNKNLSEMELAFQVLFWFLVDERKISSLHSFYPLEIFEAFSVLKDLALEWHKTLRDDIERDFPELEKHLNQISSNQTDLRSPFNQFSKFIGLKKRIAILQLHREGESSSEISTGLKITKPAVLKVKRDFTQFLEGWKKIAEDSEVR